MDDRSRDLAEGTVEYARERGADQVALRLTRAEFVDVKQRDGQVESLKASRSQALSVALFADGRYSSNSTSHLQPEAVRTFVDRCLAITRVLAPDPNRALPEPELYGPAEARELELCDPDFDAIDPDRQLELVGQTERAAREGDSGVISATSTLILRRNELLQLHSNGFEGEQLGTGFSLGASVTVSDRERRPEDHHWTAARHVSELPSPASVGTEATRRAVARRGARKVQSGRMTLVLENRAAPSLVSSLMEPLTGALIQQGRSWMEGKQGEQLASSLLDLRDDPFVRRGLGSRLFDHEGLAARPLPLFERGTLRDAFVDVYYGRKLGRPPTTGGASNLLLTPGKQDAEQLIRGVKRGILVSSFLGGNANPATGDLSFGVSGMFIEDGQLKHPVGEMNITGSHTRLWQRLSAVGDDPYPYSSWRIPTLVFDDVQFSGL